MKTFNIYNNVSKDDEIRFAKDFADRLLDTNDKDPELEIIRKAFPPDKWQDMIEWRKRQDH